MEPVSLTCHHKPRHKSQIQLRQNSQTQTTSKASNTNYVKSLKYKLRQKSQTQLRQKPQAQTEHLTRTPVLVQE